MDKITTYGIIVLSLIGIIILSACIGENPTVKTEYVCPDGSIVSDANECPTTTTTVVTTTSITTTTTSSTTTTTQIIDSDGDGWTDEQEKSAGTDPYKKDSDGDSYWDPQDPNPLDSSIPMKETTSPTSTTQPTQKSKVKIIDFFPKKGETTCGLKLTGEKESSGSHDELGITYYPENFQLWSNDVHLVGERHTNPTDAKKVMNWLKNQAITTEERVNVKDVSFGDWSGFSYTKYQDYPKKTNTWKWIMVRYDEYVIESGIHAETVSYAEEKCECVIKTLIERYEKALW